MTPMSLAAIDRAVERAAAAVALIGIGLLTLLALFVCGAIAARVGWRAPVSGDVEIVEAVCAAALYACLPWRRARRADAAVTVLAARLPLWGQRATARLAAWLDAALAGLIAWRLALGGWDAWVHEDLSTALGLPLWWSYAAMQPVSLTLAATAIWMALRVDARETTVL